MVTVSKPPSQMLGAWLFGTLGGPGAGGISFLMDGVTGSGSGWESVGVGVESLVGEVGLGSDWTGGSGLPSVVSGNTGGKSVGETEVGSSSGVGGEVGE